MKFYEALKEMIENGKRCQMPNDIIIHWDSDDQTLRTENDRTVNLYPADIRAETWQIVEEPKKKIKLYKYAIKHYDNTWKDSDYYFATDHGLRKPNLRLDHTMIEVEE